MGDLTWFIGGIAAIFAIIACLWIIGAFGAIIGSVRSFFGPRSDWVKDADMYAVPEGWGQRQPDDRPVDGTPQDPAAERNEDD